MPIGCVRQSVLGVLLALSASSAWAVQYFTLPDAQKALFPSATQFQPVVLKPSPEQVQAIRLASSLDTPLPVNTTWRALVTGHAGQADQFLGYVVADHVIGKHDYIDFALGLSSSGKVSGFEILNYRESYGGQVRSKSWRDQFINKQASDALQPNNDIQNITGATLSSSHLAQAVKRILLYQKQLLP